ncbi:hypothetical protein QBZ16_003321 [Prototheca wickerhamii]|uniref:Uncharacterized protein n=1 Tax=Prototheca wickerhamii TaxID=3111 RepID=A0AAD9MNC5_PROWI|nr:hypothetical protein QBZ16_003321 [Prototheca wickerhamii]
MEADGEGPASPAAMGDGRQPLSPLPVWGNKRTRRQRHGQEGGLRGASGDEEGPGEEEHRRSATDSAVRQLAAALPPELALPPGALLEMYHSLGGDAGGRAPAVDSVAMAMRRRGVAMHNRAGPFEEGSPAARGHAFQPVPQLRLLRGDSRSPTPPLPDAAVTPPAELMGSAAQAYARGAAPAQARGLAEGSYHAAPVWPAAPPPYGFHRALAPPENGGALGAGTRYLAAGRPDEGLLIEALKAGLGGEAARDLARDAAALDEGLAGPVRLQADRGAYGGGCAALLLGARAEAAALPRPGGGSPPIFGARPGVWGPEPGVGPGPGAQRRDAGVVAPPSPALAQEAVAAVMAAMTAWS